MNVALGSIYGSMARLRFSTVLSESDHADANRRIAQSLRRDTSFMKELKRLGVYDDDAADVIDDTEVPEE